MPYACIFVADFPAQAILRAEPQLRNFAMAVLEGAPPQERLVAMNEFARRSGVQLGMPRSLLEQCPSLALRRRSLELEAAAHAALLNVAQAFSPRVEETAPDTLVLDLAGLEQLFGPTERIAAALAQRVSEAGCAARIAVAANPDAAIAAARGFAGVTVIPPGREAEVLGLLPLAVLPAPPEIHETLERWGIRDFRALAALPAVQLSERLGQAGVRLQQLARGASTRALVCENAAAEFTAAMELEYPVEELEPLAFILGRLLDEVCARLSAHALATNEVRVRFELDMASNVAPRFSAAVVAPNPNGAVKSSAEPLAIADIAGLKPGATGNPDAAGVYERALRLPAPTRDSKLLLNLLRLSLAAHPPHAPITKVAITAAPARQRTAQGGLFVPPSPDPQRLEVTLARIASIVGEGNVGSPQLLDTHRPGAFRMTHFVAADATPHVAATFRSPFTAATVDNGGDLKVAATLALRMLRPPVRAIVDVRSGVPARVWFGGIRGEVVAASGPWRTSGDWWQRDAWQHEIWDVEIALPAAGAAGFYRIYLDCAVEEWFVQGEYD